MDHVSMHTEGMESFDDAGQPNNRGIVVAIEDLQHSQVTKWAEF